MESGMDMVTRVAKAIYETEPFELRRGKEMPWEDVDESQKEGFRVKARAAIEAMRDPPHEMLAAMWNAMFQEAFDGTQAPMVGAGFDAAIDTALKQHEEAGK